METRTHHCAICGEDAEMAADLLAGLAAAPALVADAIKAAAATQRPGWSPAEIAAHLADAEVIAAWRFRQTLAENEPRIESYDQERWAASGRYEERDVNISLQTYAVVRAGNVELLRRLDDAGWQRAYRHAEYGRTTIQALANHKSDHDLAHLKQIKGD